MIEFFRDFYLYAKSNNKYWIIPLIIILSLLAGLILLSGGSPLAPFIYTFF